MQMTKKITSVVLAVLMVVSMMSVMAVSTASAVADDGFYLVGSFNEWTASDNYKLTKNTETDANEYMLTDVYLEAGAELKVLKDVAEGTDVYYPDGSDNNYSVSEAGTYDVYFRPDADGDSAWYYGTILLNNKRDAVATVDGKGYSTFKDAFVAAGSTKVVKLLADMDVTFGFTSLGQTVIIDDNGFKRRLARTTSFAADKYVVVTTGTVGTGTKYSLYERSTISYDGHSQTFYSPTAMDNWAYLYDPGNGNIMRITDKASWASFIAVRTDDVVGLIRNDKDLNAAAAYGGKYVLYNDITCDSVKTNRIGTTGSSPSAGVEATKHDFILNGNNKTITAAGEMTAYMFIVQDKNATLKDVVLDGNNAAAPVAFTSDADSSNVKFDNVTVQNFSYAANITGSNTLDVSGGSMLSDVYYGGTKSNITVPAGYMVVESGETGKATIVEKEANVIYDVDDLKTAFADGGVWTVAAGVGKLVIDSDTTIDNELTIKVTEDSPKFVISSYANKTYNTITVNAPFTIEGKSANQTAKFLLKADFTVDGASVKDGTTARVVLDTTVNPKVTVKNNGSLRIICGDGDVAVDVKAESGSTIALGSPSNYYIKQNDDGSSEVALRTADQIWNADQLYAAAANPQYPKYTLMANLTLTNADNKDTYKSVKVNGNFVLDGNGKKITGKKYSFSDNGTNMAVLYGYMFSLANENATLSVSNLTIDAKEAYAWAFNSYTGNGGNNANNVITLDNVVINNCKSKDYVGAINAFGSCTVNLKDCTITGNTVTGEEDSQGSSVWAGAKATINIDGGTYDEVFLHGGSSSVTVDGNANVNNIRLGYANETEQNSGNLSTAMKATVNSGTVASITYPASTELNKENVVYNPTADVTAPEGYKVVESEETGKKTLVKIDDSALAALENWAATVESKTDADELSGMSWDDITTVAYWYDEAKAFVEENSSNTDYADRFEAAVAKLNAVKSIDMSNQNVASAKGYENTADSFRVFPNVVSLDLENTGVTFAKLGALAANEKILALNLSNNAGIDEQAFGSLPKKLEALDISNTGIADIGGLTQTACKDTLNTLDISNTGVTTFNALWEGNKDALPKLTDITAKGLSLTSVAGLVQVMSARANTQGALAELSWDLGTSTLTNTSDNKLHNTGIKNGLTQNGGTYVEPTIPKSLQDYVDEAYNGSLGLDFVDGSENTFALTSVNSAALLGVQLRQLKADTEDTEYYYDEEDNKEAGIRFVASMSKKLYNQYKDAAGFDYGFEVTTTKGTFTYSCLEDGKDYNTVSGAHGDIKTVGDDDYALMTMAVKGFDASNSDKNMTVKFYVKTTADGTVYADYDGTNREFTTNYNDVAAALR